jgi:S-adenosylmethionine:tRNA-ribosyltransferase-isomerase (queuine synthetase)
VGVAARARGGAAEREVEVLLLREEPAVPPERIWTALARPARALQVGTTIRFIDPTFEGSVIWNRSARCAARRVPAIPGGRRALVRGLALADRPCSAPSPYIERQDEPGDRERYQDDLRARVRFGGAARRGASFHG